MTELVRCDIEDNVATIAINNGKVNAISHQVIEELHAALNKAEEYKAVVVLTGQVGMLSAGYDLQIMRESMQAAMQLLEQGSKLTRRMLAFPYPILVACTGHAVAKGAFLLLAADYRIGTAGDFKIGLNEVAIGMSMHYAGIEMARARLTPMFFNRCTLLADMLSPKEAVTAGFLDKVVTEAEFLPTVSAVAQAMTKLDMKAHHETKLRARADLLRVLDESIIKDQAATM